MGKRRTLTHLAEEWMARVWRDRDVSAIEALHADSFVDASPAGRAADRASYRRGVEELFAAFPDFAATTEGLVVDRRRGQVAIRWTATGTHAAPFLGVAATGQLVRFQGIEVLKVRRGRIVERWGEWDGLALLDQLVAARALRSCLPARKTGARTPPRDRRRRGSG